MKIQGKPSVGVLGKVLGKPSIRSYRVFETLEGDGSGQTPPSSPNLTLKGTTSDHDLKRFREKGKDCEQQSAGQALCKKLGGAFDVELLASSSSSSSISSLTTAMVL